MNKASVSLNPSGLPETVLNPEEALAVRELSDALKSPDSEQRARLSGVVGRRPLFLEGWARLGECARDPVEAYAYFRVGYHRGLDRLRQSGWRGSGYVRWRHPENRGFLRSLYGLAKAAEELGERGEAERCEAFLKQLDPDFSPRLLEETDPSTTTST